MKVLFVLAAVALAMAVAQQIPDISSFTNINNYAQLPQECQKCVTECGGISTSGGIPNFAQLPEKCPKCVGPCSGGAASGITGFIPSGIIPGQTASSTTAAPASS